MLSLGVWLALTLGACASTPESRLRDDIWDIYWTSARECGPRYSGFVIENVKTDGTVELSGHVTGDLPAFRACYWEGVRTRAEQRRAAGLPMPDSMNLQPAVEIELE